MSSSNHRIIPFRGNFLDILKEIVKDGLLVDVILNHVPGSEEYKQIISKEMLGTRIMHVGEDYLILGPKRPLSSCLIPIDEILLVRLSEKERRDDEDLIDEKIEKNHPDWESKWTRGEETRSLSPDGMIHQLEAINLDDIPHNIAVVILISDDSDSSKKLINILSKLAKEYENETLFIQIEATKKLLTYFKANKTPAVIVSFGSKVHRIIEGLASSGDYRVAIGNVLGKYGSRGY